MYSKIWKDIFSSLLLTLILCLASSTMIFAESSSSQLEVLHSAQDTLDDIISLVSFADDYLLILESFLEENNKQDAMGLSQVLVDDYYQIGSQLQDLATLFEFANLSELIVQLDECREYIPLLLDISDYIGILISEDAIEDATGYTYDALDTNAAVAATLADLFFSLQDEILNRESIRPPSDPRNIRFELMHWQYPSSIELKWDPPSDLGNPEFTEYNIYKGESAEALILIDKVPSEALSFIDDSINECYYYTVSASNIEYESIGSNVIKVYSYQSIKGIENIVYIDQIEYDNIFIPFIGPNIISIQQNFEIMIGDEYDKRYWAQNVVFISNNGEIMNGCFEIYKYPFTDNSLEEIIMRKYRVVFFGYTISPNYPFQNKVVLRSYIENDKLIMMNNFNGFVFDLEHSFTIPINKEPFIVAATSEDWGSGVISTGSPELVIVGGPPIYQEIIFKDGTQGHVDSYIQVGEVGPWFTTSDTIIVDPKHAHTQETSKNLEWSSTGDFHYAQNEIDQGIWSKPEIDTDSVIPPEVPSKIPLNAMFIVAQCPVHLSLYDEYGRHLGYNTNGDIDYDIPNSNYIFDNDTKMMIINNFTGDYDFSVIGIEKCEYDLEIKQVDETLNEEILWTESSKIEKNVVHTYSIVTTDYEQTSISKVKLPSSLTSAVSSNTVIEGESIFVSGILSPAMSGEIISLLFDMPNDTNVIVNTTTNSDGEYNASYTPGTFGSWSVKASWKGTSDYSGAESPIFSFTVKEPEPEQPRGISGFPIQSLVLGIMLVSVLMWLVRKKN